MPIGALFPLRGEQVSEGIESSCPAVSELLTEWNAETAEAAEIKCDCFALRARHGG